MKAPPDIRRLEELVLSSAPCPHEEMHEGWLVRLAAHDVKRVRSVTAFEHTGGDAEAKIAWCERRFVEQGLPPLFRVSPVSQPPELDNALAARGYTFFEPTLIQVLPLASLSVGPRSAIHVQVASLTGWTDVVAAFRGQAAAERESHLRRLRSLGNSVSVYGAFENDEMVGSVAIVLEGEFAAVQDMHTREDCRGRGVGTAVLQTALQHARDHGASYAWLGVLRANEPARRLYARFGFETVYEYWYRQKLLAGEP